jgi:hypothetical protein
MQFLIFLLVMVSFFSLDIIRDYIIVAFSILFSLMLIWLLFGTYRSRIIKMVNVALQELELEYGASIIIIQAVSIATYIATMYGIYSFILTSNDPQLDAFRWLLILLFGSGFLANLPILGIICSGKTDNDARNMVSIFQCFWLGLNCLYLSRLIWSYGLIGKEYIFETNLIKQEVSVLFVGIFLLFLGFFLLPYLYGWRLSKQQKIALLQSQSDILNLCLKLTEEKETNSPRIVDEIKERIDKSMIEIKETKLVQHYMHSEKKIDIYEICSCRKDFREIQDLDIRFRSICLLCLIRDGLMENLITVKPILEEYKQKITDELNKEKDSAPQIWITIISLLAPLFGQYIIGIITKAGNASDPSELMSTISSILLKLN